MDYTEVLKNRYTTYKWSDRQVSDDIIQEVFTEVYNHVPSKNLKYPYYAEAVDNTDYQTRKNMHTWCHRNTDWPMSADRGNPQVLAPTLIFLSQREVVELETKFQTIELRLDKGIDNTDQIELGILLTSLVNGFTARGVNTGICQCLREQKKMQDMYGLTGYPFVAIGIGYREEGIMYEDPRDDRVKRIPYLSTERATNPYIEWRPEQEDIFINRRKN